MSAAYRMVLAIKMMQSMSHEEAVYDRIELDSRLRQGYPGGCMLTGVNRAADAY
jgi:hypothetical protein